MQTSSIIIDGNNIKTAKVDDGYYMCVIDIIKCLGFNKSSSEYTRMNNSQITGFKYKKIKFKEITVKNNCISLIDFRSYVNNLKNRVFRTQPPVLFDVRHELFVKELDKICEQVVNSFKEEYQNLEVENFDDIETVPASECNELGDIDKVEQDDKKQKIVGTLPNLLQIEDQDVKDQDVNYEVEIGIRSSTVNVDKFLMMYKQLDSYGKRHLFELLEESHRNIIHDILDQEYLSIREDSSVNHHK